MQLFVKMPVGDAWKEASLLVEECGLCDELGDDRQYHIISEKTGKRRKRLEARLTDAEWAAIRKSFDEYWEEMVP